MLKYISQSAISGYNLIQRINYMKLTKFKHACICLEKDGQAILIDPGAWTDDLVVPDNLIALIITHEHPDHYDPNKIHEILNKFPNLPIFAPQSVTEKSDLPNFQPTEVGKRMTIGAFEVNFVGGKHQTILEGYHPVFENIGVVIDGDFYHPGDSFYVPDCQIKTLSLPISAPWAKLSESADFLINIHPKLCIPIHDAVLSPNAIEVYDRWLKMVSAKNNIEYIRPSKPIEIS